MKTEKAKNKLRSLQDQVDSNIIEIREIKNLHPKLKLGYKVSPGGILNAYREGDLTFNEAVAELKGMIYDEEK